MTSPTPRRSWIVPPPPELDQLTQSLYWCEICNLRFSTLEILMHHACHPSR
jgi:hypothetical protein